jgi:hypothetical protein
MRTTKGSDRGGKTSAADGTGTTSDVGARSDAYAGAKAMTTGRPGGPGGLGATVGQRLPVPPRERKPALAALAVLLILGGALVSAYLVISSGNMVSAIQIRQQVAAGQKIPLSAMQEIQISANSDLEYVRWSDRARFSQAYAVVTLVPGTLLTGGMASAPGNNPGAQGKMIVGLALKPGQLPATGLDPGDQVSVYAVGGQGGGQGAIPPGTLLAEQAVVHDIARPGEDDLQSDLIQVSVAVPTEQAARVTQAASAGAAAVVLIPPGSQPPSGGSQPPAGPTSAPPSEQPSQGPGPAQGGGQDPSGQDPSQDQGGGGGQNGQSGQPGGNG